MKLNKKILSLSAVSLLSINISGCFSEKEEMSEKNTVEPKVVVESSKNMNITEPENATLKNVKKTEAKSLVKKEFKSGIDFKEGEHYRKVSDIKVTVETPFLVEYFWLGCPHCQKFEPVLKEFLSENKDVKIIKKHAASNQHWGKDAMIFNAMVIMGKEELATELLKLYENKSPQYPTKKDIENFVVSKGMDLEEFKKTIETQTVLDMLEESLSEMTKNKITGVPAIVVNGKYTPMPHPSLQSKEIYFELLRHLMDKK